MFFLTFLLYYPAFTSIYNLPYQPRKINKAITVLESTADDNRASNSEHLDKGNDFRFVFGQYRKPNGLSFHLIGQKSLVSIDQDREGFIFFDYFFLNSQISVVVNFPIQPISCNSCNSIGVSFSLPADAIDFL
jgi:hypothetical protein